MRNLGTYQSINFEPYIKGPLDARTLADSFSNLVDENWWHWEGKIPSFYKGQTVTVLNGEDPCLCILIDDLAPYLIESWRILNTSSVNSGSISNAAYVTYNPSDTTWKVITVKEALDFLKNNADQNNSDIQNLQLSLIQLKQKVATLEAEVNSGIQQDSIAHVFIPESTWLDLVVADAKGNPTDISKLNSNIIYYVYDDTTNVMSYILVDDVLQVEGVQWNSDEYFTVPDGQWEINSDVLELKL